MPDHKRACAYIRVSREKEDGVSPEQQKEKAELQAKLMGADLLHIYEDLDISGRSDKRPAFRQMIEDVKAGKWDCVLVYKIDRFARNVKDFHHYMEILEQHNCSLISISQNFDTDSPTGRLLRNILVDFAQFESEMISERVRDNKIANAKRGRWNGGHAPYGYKAVDKQLVVDEREAEAVRLAFRRRAEGYGVLAIAKELNMRGYKPRRGSAWGNYWSEHSVKYMLANRIYIGELNYAGETIKDAVPAIIDEVLFNAAQKTKDIPNRTQASTHLLTGLLYCAHCGHYSFQVQYHGRKHVRRYVCQTKRRKSTTACPSKILDADSLEDLIAQELFLLANESRLIEYAYRDLKESYQERIKNMSAERPKLLEELERVQRLMRELFSDYYDHRIITREQFTAKNQEYLAQEAALKSRLEDISHVEAQNATLDEDIRILKEELSHLAAGWAHLAPVERRQALRNVVKRVTVYEDYIEIDLFHLKQKVIPVTVTRTTMIF